MTPEQKLRFFDKVAKLSPDLICSLDRSLRFTFVSDACRSILGYGDEELVGQRFTDFLLPQDFANTREIAQLLVQEGGLDDFTLALAHKNRHQVYLKWSGSWSEEDEAYFFIGRDVTGEKKAQQALREKDELYRVLVENGADMLSMLDAEGNFLYANSTFIKKFGFPPEAFVGQSAFSFIHPEDVDKAYAALSVLLSGQEQVCMPEFRFKTADGRWRWVEAIVSNQLHNPSVKALVGSSRDITEWVENKHLQEERKQRFKSLFESHVDAVIYQNREGVVIDANPATLSMLGMQKQDLLHRPFTDFLPAEAVPMCQKTLQEALLGTPVRFDIAMDLEEEGAVFFDVIKIPVKVEEETVGVYSIFRDITATHRAYRVIEKQAKKMESIFESITDAFFTLDRNWCFSYVNSVFAKHEGYGREELIGKNIWHLFPDIISSDFHQFCKEAIESDTARYFEERYAHNGKVYRFSVYPSEESLSVFFTDVTEIRNTREELEKLSLVASSTTNGVVILGQDRRIEWANEGFTKMTGYSLSEAVGRLPIEMLYHEQTNMEVLRSVKEQMLEGRSIAFEVLNRRKDGEDLWLFVKANPVFDERGELVRYVTVQTDVTELKKSELSLSESAKDLYRQNRDLQQFTYIVSHNLRAPVANILGLSKVLASGDMDSSMYEVVVKNLEESAGRLDTVVRDVNTILSVRDSKHTLEKEQVCLAEIVQEACRSLQEPLSKCGGSIEIDIEKEVCVSGNKAYLHSVFYNLLSNSVKYRSEERLLRVHVSCYQSPEVGKVIVFSDNGSGFDLTKAGSNLFKLYKRFHEDKKGRGIGLYLVKTHVEAMEGRIEVDSQPNIGTRFSIYLS
ncbi:PAS domain S-box-containing protein [Pontibacter ummariensis]|uniref:histidine kinase n=1 Tax=Pontibacter ummariensis TaxID=1610492 RepID=A0A239DGD9_9BACT|nr:PAS domain S-box protein [Pontibacter ummariensis]PRY14389.1 PAS domain S-box-containing protein [Pontibacter ummariensis]SNS30833.1 PAS domain S-box-containing protein [Pontibacter ummariensis]